MEMIKCLYCDDMFEIGNGSEEHVILSALGGRKSSKNACCKTCNNTFGNTIDKSLADEFKFISLQLDIKTGRNKTAPKLKSFFSMNDSNFDLLHGGQYELSKSNVKFTELDENKKQVSIQARNQDELKKILKEIAEKKIKIDPNKLKGLELTETISHPPVAHVSLSIGREEHYRSIAKTMLTYLCTLTNPKNLRDKSFNDIVDYIKDGKNIGTMRTTINPISKLNHIRLSNISHSLIIFASKELNTVIGIYELFGSVLFSCILANEWKHKDVGMLYEIDPVTIESKEIEIAIDKVLIKECLEQDHIFGDLHINHMKEGISNIVQTFLKRQNSNKITRHIEEVLEKYLPPEGEVITDEVHMQIARELAIRVVQDEYKIPSTRKSIVDFKDL